MGSLKSKTTPEEIFLPLGNAAMANNHKRELVKRIIFYIKFLQILYIFLFMAMLVFLNITLAYSFRIGQLILKVITLSKIGLMLIYGLDGNNLFITFDLSTFTATLI